ncbi:erythromycin resistance leader peptide [Virgibacillus natechei]
MTHAMRLRFPALKQ